jgi:beta-lactamase class A
MPEVEVKPMLRRLPMLLVPILVASSASLAGCATANEDATATSEARLSEGDATVNVDGLNLRAEPSTASAVITVMPNGARVHVRGDGQDGFVPVTFGDAQGWAWGEYLTPAASVHLGSLADAVNALAAEAPQRSPGTEIAIGVQDLTTGEYAGANDVERHVSASSAKAIWVAAALHAGADLSDIALPIFRDSNNELSGVAIDRAGGCDAVNDFAWNTVGMERTLLASWFSGRRSSNQGQLGGDNYFTAKDNVLFLTRVDRGEILDGAKKDLLEQYMTWSPRSGYGGWLGTLLPAAARDSMMHKAGWLPRESYPAYATMNELGIVQVPGGNRYAVSILARHGQDYWGKQQRFLERASCVIYRTIAQDSSLGCRD